MPIVESRFMPPVWLRSPHVQTIMPALRRPKLTLPIEWERIELPDGDFLDLAWTGPQTGKIGLLLHGLEGSLDSFYAQPLLQALVASGHRAALMHLRGCSGEPNRLAISYHSGKTDDLDAVVRHINRQAGQRVESLIGVSLGGNLLLKYLGEQGTAADTERAIAISVPFRLNDAALRMSRGLSRIYQNYLLTALRHNFRERFSQIPCPLQVDVDRLRTFRQFDDQVTAPLHGFAGVDDYYGRCSSRQFLKDIRIPTLILHSRDDPFMQADTPPTEEELAESVTLELTRWGGHVGFSTSLRRVGINGWLTRRVGEFLSV